MIHHSTMTLTGDKAHDILSFLYKVATCEIWLLSEVKFIEFQILIQERFLLNSYHVMPLH